MKHAPRLAALVLGIHLGLASAFAHSATDPVPRTDKGWVDRQASFNAKVASMGSKAQLLFIGDSITQGWEGEGKEVWARHYAHRNAINLGIGGDRTQHVLWRLDNGNLDGLKPKAAVVMIGTNNSNGEDNTPEQIVDGVRAIVAKLRTKLPETQVLLVAIFPRSENFGAQRGKLAQINQALRRVADDKSVFWADFGHKFLNDDGTMPRELMPDYLHLSKKGYQIWADSIEAQVARMLGDQPVQASAGAAAGADVSGEWVLTIPGPDDRPVDIPMTLKQEGGRLGGKVARGADKFLEIVDGKVHGDALSWTMRRDRPDGSTMVYSMSGRLVDGKIDGKTETTMDGNPVTRGWTARRK
ncbi:MAG: GDSL-type esterase/lipase family protein [Verrucomicrobium sp.]|jgi:beta-glucosidase|nr:GDSL-type esterase/lipase family protein [Verrucomicrobium sp.]